jgi:hypothetical protein
MRMSVQVPRSKMGMIPDPHGVVTDHDGLAMYGDFRKVAEPRELLGQLANLFVVISRHRKDLLAANLLAVLQSPHLAPDAEIPKEIEGVIGLYGGVEKVEDRLIHLLDVSKRSITVADYVAVPEMKICREPCVRHVSCELAGDLARLNDALRSAAERLAAKELATLASVMTDRHRTLPAFLVARWQTVPNAKPSARAAGATTATKWPRPAFPA